MILGTKARYAVMAMAELASKEADRPVSLAELAECQEIPLPYLEQIFGKLRKKGVVRSVLGPGGGYSLARPSSEIKIFEIIDAADEGLVMTRCGKDKQEGCMANKGNCVAHDLWSGLEKHIHNYLNAVTLADLCSRNISAHGQ